jgi:hypothetical protein
MDIRTFYVICSAIGVVVSLAYLVLFRPPDKYARAKRDGFALSIWWIGLSQRLIWFAVLVSSLRVLKSSILNADRPIIFDGAFDKWTSLASLVVGTVAICVAFGVYLRYRVWSNNDD